MDYSIWLGWDPKEASAFAVARHSILRRLRVPMPVHAVMLDRLEKAGLYTRPYTRTQAGPSWWRLHDEISGAPMSTEFAVSRFWVPHLAGSGWALFMDCDVLVRENLMRLFEQADPTKAVMCVKHDFKPAKGVKMDGQVQQSYSRKNWSSVVLWNVDHPANKALTLEMLNSVPGRDLHRFCWLKDDEIGELNVKWNWLVGHSDPQVDPAIVHFTDGFPQMVGYENGPYADAWRDELSDWAR